MSPRPRSLQRRDKPLVTPERLTHLQRLEAESIQIMREVVAECDKPVMLYSIGKDSAVMLHVALKAFYPGARRRSRCCTSTRLWKFQAMYEFRDADRAEVRPAT